MPEAIQIPTDYERTPEFQLLCAHLAAKRRDGGATSSITNPTADLQMVEAIATRLWMRLWVVLAYEARASNRPGWLGRSAGLFEQSVSALFGDDCQPLKLLADERVKLLVEKEPAPGLPLDYFCRQFAELNPHTSGNFVRRETRGNTHSAFVRQQKELQLLALQQGSLIPPEQYRTRDGAEMTSVQANRSRMVVVQLDRALARANRIPGDFTQGLLADACHAAEHFSPEEIKDICFWLLDSRDHPTVPKTAEQILTEFDSIAVMSGVRKKGQLL